MKKQIKDSHIFKNFSLYIFACILCSSTISIAISYILLYFGLFDLSGSSIIYRITIALFFCLLFGTIVSAIIGKKSNNYVIEIANGIREVANGNFNYTLKTSDKLIFKDVADSFNSMVKELSSMEILRQDFIANFSHEFRTPINSISGYAELIKKDDISFEEKNEYADVIISESKKVFCLANNILYLSNLRSSSRLPKIVSCRVDELIRHIIVMNEKSWEEKSINLDLDLDSVTIEIREEYLYHVISNLVSNAIKFTKNSIFVSLRDAEDMIVFKISDNGIGMSEDTQKHIYDMFYQADISHNDGSGLGMSIVKKIVDICEYSLEIESEIEKGTTFILSIPKK